MSVQTTIENGIARLALDDGKVNALCEARLDEIRDGLKMAREANAIAVITGRDEIFSAGFDMKTFARGADASRAMVAAGVETIIDILTHPRPVAVFCTGHAYPMGAFLMLAADFRLGLTGDFRIGLNETAINIPVPDFALALARARTTPPAFANIAIARLFSPEDALRAGYLDCVAAPAEAPARLDAELVRLATLTPDAFRDTKARINAPLISAIRAAGLPEIGI